MLWYVPFAESKELYESKVNNVVKEFVNVNLKDLKTEPQSLAEYLLNNVLKCWKFAFHACRGKILSDNEVRNYVHYLTVLVVEVEQFLQFHLATPSCPEFCELESIMFAISILQKMFC